MKPVESGKAKRLRGDMTCIVQALEVKTMVKVKQEPGEEVEPPDEVLSSPYSILKARPRPCPLPAIAAKVCLSPW